MKICITTSEMSQQQWTLGEGRCKQKSYMVDIPNEILPKGLQDFLDKCEADEMFKRFSNIDLITAVEE